MTINKQEVWIIGIQFEKRVQELQQSCPHKFGNQWGSHCPRRVNCPQTPKRLPGTCGLKKVAGLEVNVEGWATFGAGTSQVTGATH